MPSCAFIPSSGFLLFCKHFAEVILAACLVHKPTFDSTHPTSFNCPSASGCFQWDPSPVELISHRRKMLVVGGPRDTFWRKPWGWVKFLWLVNFCHHHFFGIIFPKEVLLRNILIIGIISLHRRWRTGRPGATIKVVWLGTSKCEYVMSFIPAEITSSPFAEEEDFQAERMSSSLTCLRQDIGPHPHLHLTINWIISFRTSSILSYTTFVQCRSWHSISALVRDWGLTLLSNFQTQAKEEGYEDMDGERRTPFRSPVICSRPFGTGKKRLKKR